MPRPINREALITKNRQYLRSLKTGAPDQDLRSEILGAIFDSLPDSVLVFDETKRIVLANEHAAQVTHWDLEDLSRDEFHVKFRFYADERATRVIPVEEEPLEIAMRERRPSLREGLVKSDALPPDGVWVRAHAAPVLDENERVTGAVGIYQDISAQVRAQRQRDALVTLIAHDLKNHLAAGSILTKLIEGLATGALPPEVLETARAIEAMNARYVRMTESLLELSRSRFFQGPDHASHVDLREVLIEAIEANDLVAKDKNVEIKLLVADDVPPAFGLPATVHQIFTNVILNAVEASEPGTQVEVKAIKTVAARARVLVIDKGAGMTPDELDALFDPRRVASHAKRSTSHSTGFGLYLTAMLVESQNGIVFCNSEPGRGTTFGVEFPSA